MTNQANSNSVDSKELSIVDSIFIGKCQIKNRLGLGPINSGLFSPNGDASEGCLSFYQQYFEDGVGLVYIGGVAVSQEGRSNKNSLLLNSAEHSSGLKKITNSAHKHGTKIAIQLMHAGRQTNPDEIGLPNLAPSAIPCPVVKKMPLELDKSSIKRIIKSFAHSAKLAEQSGVDIIELHGSHGYLISGFLSPHSNKRKDEYGGTLENRFRFLQEILSEVTKATQIPVGVRLNCFENVDNGLTLEEVILGVKNFLGKSIDYLAISAGVYSKNDVIIPSRKLGKALWEPQAAELKKHLPFPVMLTGNIDSIDTANKILTQKHADIILMVRALLSDPHLLSKSLSGQINNVQECIDCNGCKYHSRGKDFVYCPFNSTLIKLHKMHTSKNKSDMFE